MFDSEEIDFDLINRMLNPESGAEPEALLPLTKVAPATDAFPSIHFGAYEEVAPDL